MTERLYSIKEIDAWIARKPSPEYDEFIRRQKEKEKKEKKEK